MDKEYLMLREELLHLDTSVNNTINLFYMFIASYLAFALTQKDTMFILMTYTVIIPAYLIVISKMQGQCKIGAYLYLFYETDKESLFHWESQNKVFREKNPNIFSYMLSGNVPFLLVSIVVLFLHIYRIDWTNWIEISEIVKLSVNIILLFFVLVLIYKNRNITTSDYIEKWKKTL